MKRFGKGLLSGVVATGVALALYGCGSGGSGNMGMVPLGNGTFTFEGAAPDPILSGMRATPFVIADDTRDRVTSAATTATVSTFTSPFSALAMQTAYGLDPGHFTPVTNQTEIIAIVDAFGVNGSKQTADDAYGAKQILADLQTYSTNNGLPAPSLIVAEQTNRGTSTTANLNGWTDETELDVQIAHAMNPNATILLVLARSDNNANLLSAVDVASGFKDSSGHAVSQVSMSWGSPEFSSEHFFDSHFSRAGVTFVAASGDSGSNAPGTSTTGVSWPAAAPNVLGVGGTTLTFNASNVPSESGWNGSGGGISTREAVPAYQSSFSPAIGPTLNPSLTHREVPDVALNGGTNVSIVESVGAGHTAVHGTSVGSPCWAAIISLANAEKASGSLNAAISDLYGLAAPASYASNFHDINTPTVSNGAFSTGPAYDNVTGLGSPVGNVLVPALSARP